MGLPQVTLWLVPLAHPNTWLTQPLLGEAFPGVQCLNSATHLPCPPSSSGLFSESLLVFYVSLVVYFCLLTGMQVP